MEVSALGTTQWSTDVCQNQLIYINTSSFFIRCQFVMSSVAIYSCYNFHYIGILKQTQKHFKRCILDNINKMRHSGITSQLHLRVVRAIARFSCNNTKLASDERFLDPVATWYLATRRLCDVNTDLRYRKPCDLFPGSHPLTLETQTLMPNLSWKQ